MPGGPLDLLSGVRVVAFTQFLLGPAAAQYLADMGADVVKVEHPVDGPYERGWSGAGNFVNGVSMFFLLAHRNVRSVGIDLKQEDGQDLARDLCRQADVVLVNFRPGVMERLGLGEDDLRRENPSMVYACGSGYGSDSPYRDLPGQDLLLQAATGLAAVTGQAHGPPVAAGAAVVDQHAASLLAMGILGALHHRTVTGQGQRVEVTMAQAGLDLQTEPLLYHLNGGPVERPDAPLGSSFHEAPYGFYPVRDGHVAVSLSPMHRVSAALDDPPELAPYLSPSDALTRREEIYKALSPLLRELTVAQLVELLRAHGVWCAPVNDYDAAVAEPFVEHLDPIEEIEHPQAGRVRLLRHPVSYGSGRAQTRRVPPRLGEHTDEVLAEAGVSPERLRRLREAGVVGGEPQMENRGDDWAGYMAAAARECERARADEARRFPHYSEEGTWVRLDVDTRSSWRGSTYEHGNWTAGFWFGVMWLAALGRDDDRAIVDLARRRLPYLADRAYDHTTHDLGFLFYPSHVLGHLCGYLDAAELEPAVEAARMTARRFNDAGRYIQAFGPVGEGRSAGTSTIDTMMNLPLLWWAHRHTGDTRLYEVARHHARTTARVFIRPDGSTVHLMRFDPVTGAVDAESTLQGASARSAWSRGSGWAAAGLAWSYAVTGEPELLAGAERASAFYEGATKPDELPPWDFAEVSADAPRDSSAAAAVALGHLVLAHAHPDGGSRSRYRRSGRYLLAMLGRRALNRDPGVDGILLHSCYSVPQNVGVDGATAWGDFFYGLALAVDHGVLPVPRLLG